MEGQDNYGNRIFFLTFPVFPCGKMEKKSFFQMEKKNHFSTLQRKNKIPNRSNLLGLRKDRK